MSIGGQSVGNVHLNSWVWRGREEGGGGRGEESEAGESTACNFAKNFIHTHTHINADSSFALPLACELCCSAQVVHKVSPTMGSVTSFPAIRQGP